MLRNPAKFKPIARQAVVSACLVCLLITTAGVLPAQSRRPEAPPDYVQFRVPDQNEGRKILEEFRKTGWSAGGGYYFEFELHVLPRLGDERVVPGRLWGGNNAHGPVTRVVLQPEVKGRERRLLVQAGAESAVWSWPAQEADQLPGGVAVLGTAALFIPLADTDLTAFELQMPFIYWPDFKYEGVGKVLGDRPANVFLLRPPATVVALKPELTGVRVYLDTQYNALAKAEELGKDGMPFKTISLGDLQKIDGQYIVKMVEVREETPPRNKTQFVVTGAALGQEFPVGTFEPARLGETVAPPAGDRVHRSKR